MAAYRGPVSGLVVVLGRFCKCDLSAKQRARVTIYIAGPDCNRDPPELQSDPSLFQSNQRVEK